MASWIPAVKYQAKQSPAATKKDKAAWQATWLQIVPFYKKKYFCHLDFDHITRASYRPLYTSFRSIKEFPLWQCSSHSKSNCIMLPSYLVRQSRDETCNSITTWDWWECFRAYHFQLLTLSSVNVYTNKNCLYPHYYKPSQIFRVKSSSCL